jgi:hypothetical protein
MVYQIYYDLMIMTLLKTMKTVRGLVYYLRNGPVQWIARFSAQVAEAGDQFGVVAQLFVAVDLYYSVCYPFPFPFAFNKHSA